jgi:SpoVK/Ycf46/Vps4 family AAA+-type ATPase
LSTPCHPARLQVKLPRAKQREAILRLTLARHVREMGSEYVDCQLLPTSSSSSGGGDDGSSGGSPSGPGSGSGGGSKPGSSPALRWLAERTEGFSGSDLVQLCSQAAAVPIQAMIE